MASDAKIDIGHERFSGVVPASYRRAREHQRRWRDETSYTPDVLAAVISHGNVLFGQPSRRSLLDRLLLRHARGGAYWTDPVLWEVACFTQFLVDLTLFRRAPQNRVPTTNFLREHLIGLFTPALGESNAERVRVALRHRLDCYGESVRRDEDMIAWNGLMTDRVLAATHRGEAAALSSETPPFAVSALDRLMVSEVLVSWEKDVFTGIVSTLEKAFGIE